MHLNRYGIVCRFREYRYYNSLSLVLLHHSHRMRAEQSILGVSPKSNLVFGFHSVLPTLFPFLSILNKESHISLQSLCKSYLKSVYCRSRCFIKPFRNCFIMVPVEGLEPSTLRLKVWCSSSWATRACASLTVVIIPQINPNVNYFFEKKLKKKCTKSNTENIENCALF